MKIEGNVIIPTGRSSTIFIATSNSTDTEKEKKVILNTKKVIPSKKVIL